MIFIYKKGTNELVGYSTQIFDNGRWREATIEELYPETDPDTLGLVVVKDSPKYALDPTVWQFKLDENGEPIGVERKPNPPRIVLSTSALDTDGDGMPELPADGNSEATIEINIKDGSGNAYKKKAIIKMSTTGGSLSARILTIEKGKAEIKFRSSADTVTAIVRAEAEGMEGDSITFEFMPV